MGLAEQKQEALRLLKKYFEEVDTLSEKETDVLFLRLSEISPDPEISNYIFFPEGAELTPEEIIEKAFRYESIEL
ncbi:MAG: hypothetical protein QNJ84_19165 [Alphaproteobacteria bacterium]|nr:hypothetical protein [Alphaproteobacteria bacterium]